MDFSQTGTFALAIGVALAMCVGVFAHVLRLDRDRAFYPVVAIVVASYYALFALAGGSPQALAPELLAGLVFVVLAALGFRGSLWLVVLALAGHGIFDFFHGALIGNPGVPAWWPPFCLGYDVTAAAGLAWLLTRPTDASLSGPARAGLFIYAKDLGRVAAFYEAVAGMVRRRNDDELVVLHSPDIQLLVHLVPPQYADGITITTPPQRREQTSLKFFFTVPSIASARQTAARLGGEVFMESWQGPGFVVCNAMDPEGNVFQVREFVP
jgi:predicted enzyme related to lactoylglutathione lyase